MCYNCFMHTVFQGWSWLCSTVCSTISSNAHTSPKRQFFSDMPATSLSLSPHSCLFISSLKSPNENGICQTKLDSLSNPHATLVVRLQNLMNKKKIFLPRDGGVSVFFHRVENAYLKVERICLEFFIIPTKCPRGNREILVRTAITVGP